MNRKQLLDAAPMMTGDLWWEPPEHPGYLVSATGKVISFLKTSPRLLKPIKMGEYRGLQLQSTAGLRKKYMHRLVLESFVGPAPDDHQAAHLDGDRRNNALDNLQWVTPVENAAHKVAHGTTSEGERNSMAKLDDAAVLAMRQLREDTGLAYGKIGKQFGVTTMTAYRAITGQAWRNV
jgi:hypothetical protein